MKNNLLVKILLRLTRLWVIVLCITFIGILVAVVFGLQKKYTFSQDDTSYTLDYRMTMPVQVRMNILKDTLIEYKEIKDGQFVSGGSMNPSSRYRNTPHYKEVVKRMKAHPKDFTADTLFAKFIPLPGQNRLSYTPKPGDTTHKKQPIINPIWPWHEDATTEYLKTNELFEKPIADIDLRITQFQSIVAVETDSLRDKIFINIPYIIKWVLLLFFWFQILRILTNLNKGLLFDAKNIVCVQMIGILIMSEFLVAIFSNWFYFNSVFSNIVYEATHLYKQLGPQAVKITLVPNAEIEFSSLYKGLLILVLATIFKKG